MTADRDHGANPYLPEGVYIPDGEVHVFGDRAYLLGSQDRFGGPLFCMEDYEVWSAPVGDLTEWTRHGVAYRKEQDPYNDGSHPNPSNDAEGGMHDLYAPDFCRGLDGRYYLYYCLAEISRVGVAVADEPIGPYEFLDYVRDASGAIVGERPGDLFQFDPAVLVDEGRVYLYTGCGPMNRAQRWFQPSAERHSMVTEVAADMITAIGDPHRLIPNIFDSLGTGFEGHELFEASSIRRVGDAYCLVYSDVHLHNLVHATADHPMGPFTYRGVLVSNGDFGLDGRSGLLGGSMPYGNNHGCVEQIDGRWYVFSHRHTDGRQASRQAWGEPIDLLSDGSFARVRLSSSGLRGAPLPGVGRYSARIASRLTAWWGGSTFSMLRERLQPRLTQEEGPDGPRQYIDGLTSGSTVGFRSFTELGSALSVAYRGTARGRIDVTSRGGDLLARIPVAPSEHWIDSAPQVIDQPSGEVELEFTFRGRGRLAFVAFELTGEPGS
ncbi:Glycosyl hydrolases family 43 [Agromyces sp. CF514]|uniref:family 43 glycosylhydrolase n=1 Tax=Agromyces sp. CF514 TaxID=1881031 RepID=UPI0008EF90D2|nr:family 43 glycosylhydrolase [Agromyces sp. CF514]SFR78427.1 Glycosyl hydrolases family 43 [Agromyces sp. CF514]